MDTDKTAAVAQIVSALISKGFDPETDGFDMRFDDNTIVLVDANGHTMSLRGVIAHVRACLD